MSNKRLVFLVEVAIFAGLALILDLIAIKGWTQGGSISLAMVPVFLISFRRGLRGGLLTGFLFGLLQLITNPYFLNIIQVINDYFFAFTAIGLAGIFSRKIKDSVLSGNRMQVNLYIIIGTFVGSLFRFIAHYISGVAFFGSSAPEGTPVSVYSLVYNGSYMLPNFILCTIVMILLVNASKRLLHT
ncbi:energy-coupled thiamine transporter ThiT [Bacillus sp. BGMRC 2118]|nr:energy-coupled thiamine transporter ThiT [Bacillus sp. BGMRC 2118]